MAKGDRFWRREQQKAALKSAESSGLVADSMTVRLELIEKMSRGEMTPQEAQSELKRIKRDAKKHGQVTRAQAFSRG